MQKYLFRCDNYVYSKIGGILLKVTKSGKFGDDLIHLNNVEPLFYVKSKLSHSSFAVYYETSGSYIIKNIICTENDYIIDGKHNYERDNILSNIDSLKKIL